MSEIRPRDIAPGVRLCAIPADRFKTSRLLLQMALPLRLGQPAQTAANAILPFLLHRSCARYPTPRALNSRLAALYGARISADVEKRGETQLLTIALTAIDDRFAKRFEEQNASEGESVAQGCAELLLDLLFSSALEGDVFPKQNVELEKRLLIEQLESEEGNKWRHASNRCEALMCSREAYGLNPLGEKEAVAALTPEEVTQAWRRALETAPMQFTFVGNNDGTEPDGSGAVCDAIARRFAGQSRAPVELRTEFIPAAGEEKFVREEQPIEQAKLFIGFRAGMKDERDRQYAMRVMADLFGGGPYSKLFLNVREKMSLCYACSARLERLKGVLIVRSGVDTDKAAQARDAILEQLRLMQAGGFTDEELNTSKRSLRDFFLTVGDTPEKLAAWYSMGLLTGEYPGAEDVCGRMDAVTRDEVIAAAQGVSLDTVYLLAARKEGDE